MGRVTYGRGCASNKAALSTHTLLSAAGQEVDHKPTGLLTLCANTANSALVCSRDGGVDSALDSIKGPRDGAWAVLGASLQLPVKDGEIIGYDNFSTLAASHAGSDVELSGCFAPATLEEHSLGVVGNGQPGCALMSPAKVLNGTGPLDTGFAAAFLNGGDGATTLHFSENCDADVRRDMDVAMRRIGTPAGVEATVGRGISVPVSGGRVVNGTWQGAYIEKLEPGKADTSVTVVRVPGAVQRRARATARQQGLEDITESVMQSVPEIADTESGVLHMLCMHTSASLCIAHGKCADNVESCLKTTVPNEWHYNLFQHTLEGVDDMTGHVKSSTTGASLLIPVINGKLAIGQEHRIFLAEHRIQGGMFGKHTRSIALTLAA